SSGGQSKRIIEARFFSDRVECEIDADGKKSKKTIPIPAALALSCSDDYRRLLAPVKVGDTATSYYFSPDDMNIVAQKSEVLGRDALKFGDRTVDALVQQFGNNAKNWVTEDGRVLQSEIGGL